MKKSSSILLALASLPALAQPKTNTKKITMEDIKMSCKLTTTELQQRKKTVIAELKGQLLEKVETSTGYRYKFEGSDKLIDLLTSFIKTERMCCGFFEFRISVAGEKDFAWLELNGPEGTKDFIKTEIEF